MFLNEKMKWYELAFEGLGEVNRRMVITLRQEIEKLLAVKQVQGYEEADWRRSSKGLKDANMVRRGVTLQGKLLAEPSWHDTFLERGIMT